MVPGNVSCFRRSVHLYTVDVFQDRWITLEYVNVPPRRVIFLVSSKPYIYNANDFIFKSSKAVAFKKEKHLSNVVSLFKVIKNV